MFCQLCETDRCALTLCNFAQFVFQIYKELVHSDIPLIYRPPFLISSAD